MSQAKLDKAMRLEAYVRKMQTTLFAMLMAAKQ